MVSYRPQNSRMIPEMSWTLSVTRASKLPWRANRNACRMVNGRHPFQFVRMSATVHRFNINAIIVIVFDHLL